MPRITPLGLHRLGPEPQRDPCARRAVGVVVDGEVFLPDGAA